MNQKNQNPRDVYSIVTNRIIDYLEKGVIPWQKPWTDAGLPRNLITGKAYRGVNLWLLNTLDYPQNLFLTYKQVQDLGGQVIRGEKAQEVIFWKWLEKENAETGEKDRIPLLKYYHVFNIDQCTGIPKDKLPERKLNDTPPNEVCVKIVNEMPRGPEIRFKEARAYYNKAGDYINMPKRETFKDNEGYYGTLFHELVHSTGHKDRLCRRELIDSKGMRSEDYAIEELTAEMGASYLKSYAGMPVEQLENSAAYIESWLEQLRKDKRFIVHASAQAQKATDYILSFQEIEKGVEYDLKEEAISKVNIARNENLEALRDRVLIKSINAGLSK